MDLKLEVIGLPVRDVDAAVAFYADRVGFHVDHDVAPNEQMRVVHRDDVRGPRAIVDQRQFAKVLANAKHAELVAEYTERFANPYIAAERGYLDDVIEPQTTRPRLIHALEICVTKREQRPPRKHGNIPL